MLRDLLRVLLVGGVLASSLACAAKRPVLSPNARFQEVGAATAQRDIDDCLQKAVDVGNAANSGSKSRGLLPWEPQPGPRWARPWARLPAGPERARPWGRGPGAAPVA